MQKKYHWLFSLIKIGWIGFGGGNALIPVIEQEIVENNKLVSKEEYNEDVIVASITPGALTVKLAGAVGKRIMGTKGMLLAALCMAVPGFVATVLMLSVLLKLDKTILRQVEFISIGITAFILSGLIQYIKGTVVERQRAYKLPGAMGIGIMVFLLSCGKNVYSILVVDLTSIFSVSTINILLIAFFVIAYTNCKFNPMNIIVTAVISGLYLLCVGNAKIIDNNYVERTVQTMMCLLSCYGIIGRMDRIRKPKLQSMKPFVKEVGTWIVIQIIFILPVVFVFSGTLEYVWKGFISVLMSIGGGDAYLTIADGMFVSNGMVSHEEFYGHLVLIANTLPGSILSKVLSGIGYYIGYGISQNILEGYLVAFAGFTCSVVASCGIFSFASIIFDKLESMEELNIFREWISTIISGLMANVILTLIYQCMRVGGSYQESRIIILVELALLYLFNSLLMKKKVGMGLRIIIMAFVAAIVGNMIR
jgi:chromate transporter